MEIQQLGVVHNPHMAEFLRSDQGRQELHRVNAQQHAEAQPVVNAQQHADAQPVVNAQPAATRARPLTNISEMMERQDLLYEVPRGLC